MRKGLIMEVEPCGDAYRKKFRYEEVPLKYDIFNYDTYENNPMEFCVVATDLDAGRAEYHLLKDLRDQGFEWICASASMPLVY